MIHSLNTFLTLLFVLCLGRECPLAGLANKRDKPGACPADFYKPKYSTKCRKDISTRQLGTARI